MILCNKNFLSASYLREKRRRASLSWEVSWIEWLMSYFTTLRNANFILYGVRKNIFKEGNNDTKHLKKWTNPLCLLKFLFSQSLILFPLWLKAWADKIGCDILKSFNITIDSTGKIYNHVHLALGRPNKFMKKWIFYKLYTYPFIKTNAF